MDTRWPGGGAILRRENISTALAVPMEPQWNLAQQVIAHLLAAASHVPEPLMDRGLHLEFGVYKGESLRACARRYPQATWHGFDSFRGLPPSTQEVGMKVRATHDDDPLPECLSKPPCTHSKWQPGKFSVHGARPKDLPSNVALHVGWFNETLVPFIESTPAAQPVAFCHLDADLYVSTILVLNVLFSRCRHRRGTVLAFDELFGSVAQLEHEYRALKEASLRWGVSYRFVSYAITPSPYVRAAVQITDTGSRCRGSSHGGGT